MFCASDLQASIAVMDVPALAVCPMACLRLNDPSGAHPAQRISVSRWTCIIEGPTLIRHG